MSTKSHIICGSFSEMFEETSEPKHFWGRFQGYNIYLIIGMQDLKSFKIDGDFITVEFLKGDFSNEVGNVFKFWGGDVPIVDFDCDGILFVISGGSFTAKKLQNKEWDKLKPSNDDRIQKL